MAEAEDYDRARAERSAAPGDARPDNAFEPDKAGTNARSDAEAAIEDLRLRGGVFVDAVRATRMPMVLTDPNLPGNPIVFANASFLKLSGYSMDEVLGQQPHFMNGRDTDPRDSARFEEALRSEQDDIIETVQYRKDGSLFVATVLVSAFKDEDGRTLNHFMSWLDVTRRVDAEAEVSALRYAQAALRESEAALRESERLRAAMLDVLPLGLGLTDLDGNVLLSNREWQRFVPNRRVPSRDPDRGSRWRSWDGDGRLVEPSDYPTARALRGETVVPPMEFLYTHDDGCELWTSVGSVPLRDADDRVIGAVSVIQDVDAAKRAAELQKTLLAELQHRVRNIFAVIRSIVRRTMEEGRSVEDYVNHLEGRISALARTQILLTRKAGAGVDLQDLIRDELVAQAAAEDMIALDGPDVVLAPKAAEVLALAIHELATNATKYGAFSRAAGRLAVAWEVERRDGQDWLSLDWTESGVPIVEAAPIRQGFGTDLIARRIPYELGGRGRFELRPGGLSAAIEFPLVPGESLLQTDGGER